MWEKIKSVLGSIRFWQVTLAAAALYVGYTETNGFLWSDLVEALGYWLGVVAGIGTLDSFAEKLLAKKK